MQGTIPEERFRKRYKILQARRTTSCLNFIILDDCEQQEATKRETLAILRTRPDANGSEVKHLSEIFRSRPTKKGRVRERETQSAKRNARKADARIKNQQWGESINEHARRLDANRETNLLQHIQRFTRRQQHHKEVKTELSLSFLMLYRMEQARLGFSGPIFVYDPLHTLLFLRMCGDPKFCYRANFDFFLALRNKDTDYCFVLADLCSFLPSYQIKIRAKTTISQYLGNSGFHLADRYTIKVLHSYDNIHIKKWATRSIMSQSQYRPNWANYVISRLNVVTIPMSTWNLHLVNIQRAARNHKWTDEPATYPAIDDLTRLPANSKSRFSLEEEHAHTKQRKHCCSFLTSIGLNYDLIALPRSFTLAAPETQYVVPREMDPLVTQSPELLAADLFRCTTCKDNIYTVEDKDPSVLWRMSSTSIFRFWHKLIESCPQRWEIMSVPTAEILDNYRRIIDRILPNSLIGGSTAFSTVHLPYAYFTIKYKCFKGAVQNCCNTTIPAPAQHAPSPVNPHPAHSCPKDSHSCMRNIISFKKMPGRKAFKRIGRAFMHVVTSVLNGFGMRDLSQGKRTLEQTKSKTI
jgi:hypothetical protein